MVDDDIDDTSDQHDHRPVDLKLKANFVPRQVKSQQQISKGNKQQSTNQRPQETTTQPAVPPPYMFPNVANPAAPVPVPVPNAAGQPQIIYVVPNAPNSK